MKPQQSNKTTSVYLCVYSVLLSVIYLKDYYTEDHRENTELHRENINNIYFIICP